MVAAAVWIVWTSVQCIFSRNDKLFTFFTNKFPNIFFTCSIRIIDSRIYKIPTGFNESIEDFFAFFLRRAPNPKSSPNVIVPKANSDTVSRFFLTIYISWKDLFSNSYFSNDEPVLQHFRVLVRSLVGVLPAL